MPKSLSKLLNINVSQFKRKGTFDPILNVDSRFFIDPHLLKYCDIIELKESYNKLQKRFLDIAKLLNASDKENDIFWNKADKLMKWSEVKGLCIGYSSKGTSGSGIGPELRKKLLQTAKYLIDKGKSDPELFELVGIFEEGFGPDRISDMTANIIKNDLHKYSLRILSELDINIKEFTKIDKETNLPINPYTNEPIYLVPKEILRNLPVAFDWSYSDQIKIENEELREKINKEIGYSWKEFFSKLTKEERKNKIFANPNLFDSLIKEYIEKEPQYYNFSEDIAGEYQWYFESQKILEINPLKLSLPVQPTIDDVENLVIKICERFKSLIEDNGLSYLLYDLEGKPKHETASQLLFYGIAESYCEANQIMISRECDGGRGPVDFKFGTNFENSVLVEIKKSTNTSGLKKGISKQLPIYMNAEKSKRAIYLVIDVGFTEAAIDNLEEINNLIKNHSIKIFHVDGNQKPSASK